MVAKCDDTVFLLKSNLKLSYYPEKALGKYDAFFGEDEAYTQFKKSIAK